jgi:hypothetical protein
MAEKAFSAVVQDLTFKAATGMSGIPKSQVSCPYLWIDAMYVKVRQLTDPAYAGDVVTET